MYGLRLIGPVVIGMSDVSVRRFAILNMIGALIWAAGVGGSGYVFGQAITWLLTELEFFEKWALVGAVLGAGSLLLLRLRQHWHH